ncbi:MAG: hypothetical protein HQL89_09685 [Magnetococcales bacterium]|nr:hypothetical protein [Magnetococcales bacterium]
MIILGVWDGHDAGAALLVAGRLVAAVNEERLSRRKLEACFPHRAIAECLSLGGVAPREIDHVAVATRDVAKTLARLVPATRERYYHIRRRLSPPDMGNRISHRLKQVITLWPGFWGTDLLNRHLLRQELAPLGLERTPIHLCPHHPCHAATAAWFGGLDEATVLTLDGVGDGLSGTASLLEGGILRPLAHMGGRDSLGLFFEQVTHLLNMRELEDEGKVMALSDYAPPIADEDNPLLDLFRVEGLTIRGRLHGEGLTRYLRTVLWSTPWERFAAMAQRTLEVVGESWTTQILAATGQRPLALAGGVFSNIRLNGRLRRLGDGCFVFPHMGDGGLAVGAAAWLQRRLDPRIPIHPLTHVALGRSFTSEEIGRTVRAAGASFREVADPAEEAAARIVRGEVIGWFQGGMEYGPRALGHRSILAAADQEGMRDRLNLALKRRAWYQPFCPSMLEEEASVLLSDGDGRANPFMTMSYQLRPSFRRRFAQIASIDGSCRPQMVGTGADPFHRLLKMIQKKTGHGIVLNTSFNLHGQPLVHTPGEALAVLRQTPLTALIMENILVEKQDCHD